MNSTCATDSDDDPRAVGRTPSIAQGWRPYSATTQPNSAAIQGSGHDQSEGCQKAPAVELALADLPERRREQHDEVEAESDHDAERPEERRDVGHGVLRGAGDRRVVGLARIVDVSLEQQGVTEVGRVRRQGLSRVLVGPILAQTLKRVIGDEAVLDPLLRLGDEIENAFDGLIERARRDQSERPGDLDFEVD